MTNVIDGPSRRRLLQAGGLAAAGAALAACTKNTDDSTTTSATSGAAGSSASSTKGSLVWATHVYYNQPALIGIEVGFRDFLEPMGWTFQVTAARTTGDVQQTLQAQSQALALKPTAIVASMTDKTSFTDSLQAIKDAGIYLQLNNTQPDEGNGLDLPYIGQSFIQAGTSAITTVLDAAVANGKSDGTVVICYCCGNLGAVGSRTAGMRLGLQEYNAANNTNFVADELLDVSDTDPATAQGTWVAKMTQLGDALVGISASQGGEPMVLAAQQLGKTAGQIPMATFDITEARLKYIEEGWLTGVVDQQPYAQGWVAAAQAYMFVAANAYPIELYNTGSVVILKDGVEGSRKQAKYIADRAKALGIAG